MPSKNGRNFKNLITMAYIDKLGVKFSDNKKTLVSCPEKSFVNVQPDMDTLAKMIREAWDAHIQEKKKKGKA